SYEPFEGQNISLELLDGVDCFVHQSLKVLDIDELFLVKDLNLLGLEPEPTLSTSSTMELDTFLVLSDQISTTATRLHGTEATGLTNESHVVLIEVIHESHRSVVDPGVVNVHCRCDRLRLAHILELNWFVGEETLLDIGVSELSTGCGPGSIRLLSDEDRIVHETHLTICFLVLELVSILSAEVHDELDDLRSCIRDLDRVGLDVNDLEALFLNRMLEI